MVSERNRNGQGREDAVPATSVLAADASFPKPLAPQEGRTRLLLGTNRHRQSYDLRLRLWLWLLSVLVVVCVCGIVWQATSSTLFTAGVGTGAAAVCALASGALFEQLTRPLQTLSNVVAALREDDFSFRARVRGAATPWVISRWKSTLSRVRCKPNGAQHGMLLPWQNV